MVIKKKTFHRELKHFTLIVLFDPGLNTEQDSSNWVFLKYKLQNSIARASQRNT